MINKRLNLSKKNFLLLLYLVILASIGPLVYWLNDAKNNGSIAIHTEDKKVKDRVSFGNQSLITANNSVAKQDGIKAFANGNYSVAAKNFAAALNSNPNDPETLIYRNNAVAISSNHTYKIGVSVPIGGNLGVAQEILRGVAQAQNTINQNGGVAGNLIVVEIANDDNDPEIAKQIADNFVKDMQILAVIGHNDSDASAAAAPIYQENGLVMITPTSSADHITTVGSYIFRTTPNTRALAATLADYAVRDAEKTKIALCVDSQSEVSQSFQEEFTWSIYKLGGKILPTQCDFSAPDFLADNVISKAISDGADALLIAPSVKQINKAIEVAKSNEDRLALFGSHGMVTYSTLKEGKASVNGMVAVVAWNPDSQESNASFIAEANNLWGGSVNWRTAMAYDATKTILAGLNTGYTRDRLQQVLASPQFTTEGSTKEINFLPSGDRNMQGTMVRVQPGNLSGTGFDFVSFQKK
jgi:branched-chain amino acid transport system substrate-binding protein